MVEKNCGISWRISGIRRLLGNFGDYLAKNGLCPFTPQRSQRRHKEETKTPKMRQKIVK